MPQLYDHLMVLAFAVVMPVYGLATWPALKRSLAANEPGARAKSYVEILIWQGVLTIAGLTIWILAERPWSELGLSLRDGVGFWVSAAIGGVVIVFFLHQLARVFRGEPKDLQDLRSQLEPMKEFLPHTRSERNLSIVVAISAGISEEILWRGFLLLYLQAFLPTWAAATIAVLGFGLGHLYQGVGGAAKCTVLGSVAMLLYVVSGSLFVPILLHAVVDIQGMLLSYRVLGNPQRLTPSSA